MQALPQGAGPAVRLVSRETIRYLLGHVYRCANEQQTRENRRKLAEHVRELRDANSPAAVAFPVCMPGHHYAVLMRQNRDGVVEVVALDSNWGGYATLQKYQLSSPPFYDDQREVFTKLEDQGAQMVVLDGYMKYVCAVLAQTFWPEPIVAEPRRVIQRFPLMPHQGATLDCGVHVFYYLAALYARPQ